eukprot:Filipodium_phascolosomae@DN446_c0_g1_i1.p1
MSVARDRRHKRRKTGGRQISIRKKRSYEKARPAANTHLQPKRVRNVRVRGGHYKFRALRLDHGNYSWGGENCTRPTRIIDVLYNSSNNELVRTKTLVKNTIVAIDASPFKTWYMRQYGIDLGKKTTGGSGKKNTAQTTGEADKEEVEVDDKTRELWKERAPEAKMDPILTDQFTTGRILACISSRPGQVGRADGYVLEGKELEFYKKKLEKKK